MSVPRPNQKEKSRYEEDRRNSRDIWAGFFDPLAVQIVSIVTARLSKDGKLYAYDGIESARQIRDLLADKVADSFWSKTDRKYRPRPYRKKKAPL